MSKTTILIVTCLMFFVGFSLPFFTLDLLNIGASEGTTGATLDGAFKSTIYLAITAVIGLIIGVLSALVARHLVKRIKK